jgi:hypothetical protein
VHVLAALISEKVGDLLHESRGGLVGGCVTGHLNGLGHDVADGFDLLDEEVLGLSKTGGEGG